LVQTQIDPARVLMTCAPESEAFALQEIRAISPGIPTPRWLTDGVALFSPGMPYAEWAEAVRLAAPIFVRHIAPVQWEINLDGSNSDLVALVGLVPCLAAHLDNARGFAVQSRIIGAGKLPYHKFSLNSALSTAMEHMTGATMVCREPDQILSVLCMPSRGYLGLSDAALNRSPWPGGEHRFKRDDGQICRSEFKLLEAFRTFDLRLPERGQRYSGRALDLGAAPGGWTRVLRQHGYAVTAVDPADLDARIRCDPSVQHVRRRAEEFLMSVKSRFAMLVNDMRKDPLDSVNIMLQAQPLLLPGASAVLTLKLSHAVGASTDTMQTVRMCLDRLARSYAIVGARQLYHNRSEVTVALRARSD